MYFWQHTIGLFYARSAAAQTRPTSAFDRVVTFKLVTWASAVIDLNQDLDKLFGDVLPKTNEERWNRLELMQDGFVFSASFVVHVLCVH